MECGGLPRLYVPIQNTLITGLFLSTVSLSIHLAVKRRTSSGHTGDDVCLLISWGLSVATQAIILRAAHHGGLGVRMQCLNIQMINAYQKMFLAASCCFMATFCVSKLAQLIFLRRLVTTRPRLRTCLRFLAFLVVVGSAATLGCLVFACRPVSKSWTALEEGRCLNRGVVYVTIAVLNIIADVFSTALPVCLILSLRWTSAQKTKAILMMLVFSVTAITGALRLYVTIPLLHADDPTYSMAPVALLVGAEVNLFLVSASVPGIRQCFRIISEYSPREIRSSSLASLEYNEGVRDFGS